MNLKPIIDIITVIDARFGPENFPHRAILSLAGKPLLVRVYERIKTSRLNPRVVVSTTTHPDDNIIAAVCKDFGIPVFRTRAANLLERCLAVGKQFHADALVSVNSGSPLVDPSIIDRVIGHFILNQNHLDYVSNSAPCTYPVGCEVEVVRMEALKPAVTSCTEGEYSSLKEYLQNPNSRLRNCNIVFPGGQDLSTQYRWIVENEADYIFVKAIYDELFAKNPRFSMNEILRLLNEKSHLMSINNHKVHTAGKSLPPIPRLKIN